MPSYASAVHPVRDDIQACHADWWERLAGPGTWWEAGEKLAIAAEARAARACALCRERKDALSPTAGVGGHDGPGVLPEAVVDTIHRIVTDPGRLSKSWCDALLEAELDDARYVELVSTVVMVTAIDIFARALDVPVAALPAAKPGTPSRLRPDTACPEGAWVPQLSSAEAGGDEWAALYGRETRVPQIGRALSLVPDCVRDLFAFASPHYMELHHVVDPAYAVPGRALDRLQMELVAARVSRINDCFY